MQPHIANNYLFLPTAKATYEFMMKTYSKKGNKARMHGLQQKVA